MKGGGHDPKREGHDPPPEAGEVSHRAVRVLGGGSLLVSPPPCSELRGDPLWALHLDLQGGYFLRGGPMVRL